MIAHIQEIKERDESCNRVHSSATQIRLISRHSHILDKQVSFKPISTQNKIKYPDTRTFLIAHIQETFMIYFFLDLVFDLTT